MGTTTYEQFKEKNKSLLSLILDSDTEKIIQTIWENRQLEIDDLQKKLDKIQNQINEKDSLLLEKEKEEINLNEYVGSLKSDIDQINEELENQQLKETQYLENEEALNTKIESLISREQELKNLELLLEKKNLSITLSS